MTLRPYQLDMMARLHASTARAVCVQLPTGGGKSHLIREVATGRALVLAHAEWLIDQLHALVGGHVLKAGMPVPRGWPIVAMVQTAARRDLPEPDAVICDECHHCPSGTYRKLLAGLRRARLYGFSATPRRLDGLGLGDQYDELLCGQSYRELISAGWLKPFEVLSVPSGVDLAGARTRGGDFAREDVKERVRRSTIFGDVVEHYLRHARHLGGHASFWSSIEMAEHAAERFRARGVRCVPLHSKMRGEPATVVRALRGGAIDSVATVDMIGEGLDVPGLSSVSRCRPTQSLTVYLQQAGRSNRGGDGVALVLDHVADWQRHGLPDDDREWTLEGAVKRRAAPGLLSVWDCPGCWCVNLSTNRACTRCGAGKPVTVTEMEERAADLERITRADPADIHAACSTPAQYVAFARAHGKQALWGALKWAERGKRARADNPFLAAAGAVRPTLREFLAAAEACGLASGPAQAYGRAVRLQW